MQILWLFALIVSSALLLVVIIRKKVPIQWFGYLAMNLVVAALFLYVINLLGSYVDLRIPINAVTVCTVTVLGIPGVLLLVSLRLVLPI